MKKLKLRFQDFGATEVLTREQLKKIMGGDGSGGCNEQCPENTFICYCHGNNQLSCVYGANIPEAMYNFLDVCPAYMNPICSDTWDCN